MVKLVTLDITNTVIRVLGGVGQQYASVASIYGLNADPDKINKAFKHAWTDQNHKYPNFGVSAGLSAFSWWSEVVKQCFIKCGYDDSEKLSRIATHLYLHFKTKSGWEVLPEARKILKAIKSKGIMVGAISNFDERLEDVLASVGLLHHFDTVLCSQLVGCCKPDPRIYQKALELSGVCAKDALHVGDNLENDYLGPRAIGMCSVLLSNKKHEFNSNVDKEYVISDLTEIMKFID